MYFSIIVAQIVLDRFENNVHAALLRYKKDVLRLKITNERKVYETRTIRAFMIFRYIKN